MQEMRTQIIGDRFGVGGLIGVVIAVTVMVTWIYRHLNQPRRH